MSVKKGILVGRRRGIPFSMNGSFEATHEGWTDFDMPRSTDRPRTGTYCLRARNSSDRQFKGITRSFAPEQINSLRLTVAAYVSPIDLDNPTQMSIRYRVGNGSFQTVASISKNNGFGYQLLSGMVPPAFRREDVEVQIIIVAPGSNHNGHIDDWSITGVRAWTSSALRRPHASAN